MKSELGNHELSAISRVEIIKWLDHASYEDWSPVHRLRIAPQEIISIGVVVRETDDVVVIAPTLSDVDLAMEEWVVAETTMIVKALVVYRALLTAPPLKGADQ